MARAEPLALPEVTLVFVDRDEMAALNWRFLKHAGPTDVITFQHGDIVICPAIAAEESETRGLPFEQELFRYGVHGWLHLSGFDDKRVRDRERMHRRQEALIAEVWQGRGAGAT